MAKKRRKQTKRQARAVAFSKGFRSVLELEIAEDANSQGIKYKYEADRLNYSRPQTYTPDFKLKNGIYVESKGYFESKDRTKHLLVREANPEVDIRFVFGANNFLTKKSKKRYGDWCDKHGFKWAMKRIPKEWANE